MVFDKRRRRARIVLTVGFFLLLGVFCGLGAWQLDRAEQKRRLFQAFAAGSAGAVVTGLMDGAALSEHRYRRLELRGTFLSSKQILLDSLAHAGHVGYQVLTPFRPLNSERWIVVNRGWVGAAPDRTELPDLAVDEAQRTIRGRIDALPRPGLRLGPTKEMLPATWPRVLLFPTLEEVEEALGVPLVGYQLLLDPREADGFLREWQPRSLPPERHLGYALQWFGFAVVLVAAAVGLVARTLRSGGSQGTSNR